jgi:hypothetical protein
VALTENGAFIRTNADRAIEGDIALPVDEAFAAMLLAYQKLGITATTNDPDTHRVGNMTVSVVHRFNGQDLSKYFECGRDAFGTPRADRYRITFSVVSRLAAEGTADTQVETLITARGTDPGGQGSDLYCSSSGRLELELVAAARQP